MTHLVVLTDLLLSNAGEDRESALYRVVLQRALMDVYRNRNEDDAPTYSDMATILQGYQDDEASELNPARVQTLVDLLKGFLMSPHARFFNTRSKEQSLSRFAVFDLYGIDTLPSNIQQAIVYVVCNQVRKVAFDPRNTGQKYVIMDEVAQLIRQTALLNFFEELLKTARKHNTSVWVITQNYVDYSKLEVAETVQVNSTSLFLLSHSKRATKALDKIIEDWGLNGREAKLFRELNTKKGEYSEMLVRTEVWDAAVTKRPVSARLRLYLSPLDYEITTSDPDDREFQNRFIDANPSVPLVDVLEHVAKKRSKKSKAGRAA